MINTINKADCFGCGACKEICNSSAIKMVADDKGFVYPELDSQKCINCHMCEKVCQIGKDVNLKHDVSKKAYAVKGDDNIRMLSSSGGFFSLISDYILSDGQGKICGVRFDEQMNPVHDLADCSHERNRFRGAKYIQSNLYSCLSVIADMLKNGENVLFTGTSCQVAALYEYLEARNISTETLFTIDIICHGVASPKVWKDYKKFLQRKYRKTIIDYSFRDKNCGWHGIRSKLTLADGSTYSNTSVLRIFGTLYSNNLIMRSSCYYCPYTEKKRVGDITMGDFWGIEKINEKYADDKGVSLVVPNTTKGQDLLQKALRGITFCIHDFADVWQPNLLQPTDFGLRMKEFWEYYNSHEFGMIARKYGRYGILGEIYYITRRIRRILSKI